MSEDAERLVRLETKLDVVLDNQASFRASFEKHDDRIKVLEVLETEAAKAGRVVDALLQVHIAQEETKFGFSSEELLPLMTRTALEAYPHVRVRGLMGMASFSPDESLVNREFARLRALFLAGKEQLGVPHWDTLSMGMSGDWPAAVANGSTLIRVGSALFGSR